MNLTDDEKTTPNENQDLDNVGQEENKEASNTNDEGNETDNGSDNVGQEEKKEQDNKNEELNENELYGAPENYDFKNLELPEGVEYNESYSDKFAVVARELNLSQNSANKIANLYLDILKEQAASAPEKIKEFKEQLKMQNVAEWEKEVNTDNEICGGNATKLNSYMDKANIGYKNFASEGLKKVLNETGLVYNKEMIKLFYKLSDLTGEDKILSGKPAGEELTPAQILYGNK